MSSFVWNCTCFAIIAASVSAFVLNVCLQRSHAENKEGKGDLFGAMCLSAYCFFGMILLLELLIGNNTYYKPVGEPIEVMDTQGYTVASWSQAGISGFTLEPKISAFAECQFRLKENETTVKPLDAEHPTPCVEAYKSNEAGYWFCSSEYYVLYVDKDSYTSLNTDISLSKLK